MLACRPDDRQGSWTAGRIAASRGICRASALAGTSVRPCPPVPALRPAADTPPGVLLDRADPPRLLARTGDPMAVRHRGVHRERVATSALRGKAHPRARTARDDTRQEGGSLASEPSRKSDDKVALRRGPLRTTE